MNTKAVPPQVGMLLSEVKPEQVRWLWRGRIPLGKITTLDGDPSLGKSLITLDLAARVSRNREMPDATPGVDGGVVLASGEDGLADTIRPRLEAMGAELTRILDVTLTAPAQGTLLKIPDDLSSLDAAIVRVKAILVVIDPVYAFLNAGTNTDKDAEIRQALAPLAKLAEKRGVAVVLVRHLNKAEEKKALYRGGGSIALIGLARSGLLVARSRTSDANVLASLKCNLSAQPASLRYSVEPIAPDIPHIAWLGEGDETPDELTAPLPQAHPSRRASAEAFLSRELSLGPLPSRTLEERATRVGIATKTYQRAREALGVLSHQTRDGWVSALPTQIVRQSDSHSGGGDGEFVAEGLA